MHMSDVLFRPPGVCRHCFLRFGMSRSFLLSVERAFGLGYFGKVLEGFGGLGVSDRAPPFCILRLRGVVECLEDWRFVLHGPFLIFFCFSMYTFFFDFGVVGGSGWEPTSPLTISQLSVGSRSSVQSQPSGHRICSLCIKLRIHFSRGFTPVKLLSIQRHGASALTIVRRCFDAKV